MWSTCEPSDLGADSATVVMRHSRLMRSNVCSVSMIMWLQLGSVQCQMRCTNVVLLVLYVP